jgi:two-component system, NtrC family, response regulator AtoC
MSSTNRRDIVIVEDNVAVAQFVAAALDEEGYRTCTFHDGRAALAAIIAQPPALVLLDLDLPLLSGAELLARLRADVSPDLAVVIMSAGTQAQRLINDGATALLAKPFDLDVLLACVAQYVIPERPNDE